MLRTVPNTCFAKLFLHSQLHIFVYGPHSVSQDITSGLQPGKAEVLRGLRNFLHMDRPEHHRTNRLKERWVIIIIIITFKGAIRDFFTFSSQRRTRTLKWPEHNHVQITCNTSSAYHVQVSCYVPLGTKGQLSCLVWQSWNRIYLSFILLAEPLNRWRRGGNRSTRRKPLATSFRKCHILQPEDSSPKWDSNPRSSIGGRLGKQTC